MPIFLSFAFLAKVINWEVYDAYDWLPSHHPIAKLWCLFICSDKIPLLHGSLLNRCLGNLEADKWKIEAFWPKLEGFHEVVEAAWQSVQPGPCPFSTLNLKIRVTAKGLQAWSDKKVGHVASQLAMAREILHMLEIAQDSRALTPEELMMKFMLKKRSLMLSSLKRTIARSRSRITWLKEGDANTKFFHMHARHRKRKNFIAKLEYEDGICTSHEEKSNLVDEFYVNLLGTNVDRENSIDLQALGLPSHDLAVLEAPFSEKEV
jgi:hypothetical protein